MVVFVVKLVVKLGGKRFRIVTWPDNQMGNMQLDHKKGFRLGFDLISCCTLMRARLRIQMGKEKKLWEQFRGNKTCLEVHLSIIF